MALKDILVHTGGTAVQDRLTFAATLAEAHGAHLTGLYVTEPADIPPYVEAQLTAAVLDQQAKFNTEERRQAQSMFEHACKGRSIVAEWRTDEGFATDVVQLHGRHADLAVVGQSGPDPYARSYVDLAGRLVLSMGRPVMVVPHSGTVETIGRRVLVAWDGSRTAARALGDAMDILERADAVEVVSINPHPDHAPMAGVDIAAHLAHHGIAAEARELTEQGVDVGAMLLSRAADLGADMMVMGAYGHARWRELVLGGVTEHVLKHMTVPVLMSH